MSWGRTAQVCKNTVSDDVFQDTPNSLSEPAVTKNIPSSSTLASHSATITSLETGSNLLSQTYAVTVPSSISPDEKDHCSSSSNSPTSSTVPVFDHAQNADVQRSLDEPVRKSRVDVSTSVEQPRHLLERASEDYCSSSSSSPTFSTTPVFLHAQNSAVQNHLKEPMWNSSCNINTSAEQPRSLFEKASVYPNLADLNTTEVSSTVSTTSQRSNTAWLTSVVTPRPYGSQSTGRNTLTRSLTVEANCADKIMKKAAQPSADERNQCQEEKTLDLDGFGIRSSHSLSHVHQPSASREGKKQEEEERRKNIEEKEYGQYQGESQERQRTEQKEEQWGSRNRDDFMRIRKEEKSTMQRKNVEAKMNWLEKEQNKDTTNQQWLDGIMPSWAIKCVMKYECNNVLMISVDLLSILGESKTW
ncbi:hypothetical protein ACEWY4_023609 [Coilia grayii]|uniref:Uncharacterized protein n=1 Tax=Coilia grayii TaxID=363190 RepID=A0ABD1J6U5_9TELE